MTDIMVCGKALISFNNVIENRHQVLRIDGTVSVVFLQCLADCILELVVHVLVRKWFLVGLIYFREDKSTQWNVNFRK